MADKVVYKSSGSGMFLLGILFIVLKLTGVIAWPWIWVLSPFWIGIAVLVTMLLIFGFVVFGMFGLAWVIDKIGDK
jgi:hypothetical protein